MNNKKTDFPEKLYLPGPYSGTKWDFEDISPSMPELKKFEHGDEIAIYVLQHVVRVKIEEIRQLEEI